MNDDLFDNPGSTTLVSWEELSGRLLLIQPHEIESDITTEFGVTDAIRADVVVLDGPEAPNRVNDVLVFPRVLQGQLRRNVGSGRFNLGRLGQGEKRKGQSAPWTLTEPTDADRSIARQYLAGEAVAPF